MLASARRLPSRIVRFAAGTGLRTTMVIMPLLNSPVTVTTPPSGARLDAVIDGVLEQRLQHEARAPARRVGSASIFHSTRSRSPRRSCSMRW